MSDTSAIDLSQNRITPYENALDHVRQRFIRVQPNDDSALEILGAVLDSPMRSTELIHPAFLRPVTIEAQKMLAEMHVAVVSAYIESLRTFASVIPSRPVQVAHFHDIAWRIANSNRIANSEWDSLFEKLEGLRNYKVGWNGYSAPAPSITAINNARDFLDVMRDNMCIPTRVAASAVGGVGVTRREGPRKVCVEFFNNSMVSALFADDAAEEMHTKQATAGRGSYEDLISLMKDYLSG